MDLIEQKNLLKEIDEQIGSIDLSCRLDAERVNKIIKALDGDLEAGIMSDISITIYYISLLFMRKQLKV